MRPSARCGRGRRTQFWLGTDTIGRDILSRLIYGAQITIFVALVSSLLSFGLGRVLWLSGGGAGGLG